MKIMLFFSFLECNLFTFFIKLCWNVKSYSPDLKVVLIFLVTKVFQKGTMFSQISLCLTITWDAMSHMVSDNVVALTVCKDTLSQEKNSAYQIRSYVKMTINQKEELKH